MSLKDKYQNGKIPNSALKKLDTGQYLEKNAANAFMKMKAEAKKQGVNIKLTGDYSAYRKCGDKGDFSPRRCDTGFTQWCAWEKYKAGVGNLAANPTRSKGCSSNHGWGIAVDISGSKAQNWIKENGEKYGWWWGEAPSENWHFTYDVNKDTTKDKDSKQRKTTIIPYILLGLGVVTLSYGFFLATRPSVK
tara:strand:- start:1738 stop:2310 length:573 start_codon:yes stop_codon:yes gene_type:complete